MCFRMPRFRRGEVSVSEGGLDIFFVFDKFPRVGVEYTGFFQERLDIEHVRRVASRCVNSLFPAKVGNAGAGEAPAPVTSQ